MYLVIWRYHINPAHRQEFERYYSFNGPWVRLFEKQDGFIRTELLRDISNNEYVTMDYWRDPDSYISFQRSKNQTYLELDKVCDALTIKETFIGAYSLERENANW